MDPADFRQPEAGRIIQTPHGYAAFVPAPLPPKLAYEELALPLSRADTALSELSGLGRTLPNPDLLIGPYLRREAVLSSRIEGTRATLADLFLHEATDLASQRNTSDLQEVGNYVVALKYGIDRLGQLPLSLRLVRELHEILMKGVRGGHATPGEFRRSQNWIGPAGSTLATALYVPPPPDEMRTALNDWEHFLHERDVLPDLIQCALIHEQFEAIHPFLDGNGRVGRLLITLFLLERGRLSQPLLYLSTFFEAYRDDYYELLQGVRTRGDWTSWLRFFLKGVTDTAREAASQTTKLLELRETFHAIFRDKPRARVLLDELFANPFITVARAAEILEVSNPTARQTIELLRDRGMLEEISGRNWRRIYRATPIMSAIQI